MTEGTGPQPASSRLAQWFGLLAGPVGYGLVALFSYFIAPSACNNAASTSLLGLIGFAVSLVGLALCAAGAVVAFRNRRHAQQAGAPSDTALNYLGVGGILVSSVFLMLTLFASFANLAFRPCQQP
jgi:hypothetical protein